MRKFLLLTAGICTAYAQMKCPKVDCEDKEGILSDKGGCFYATQTTKPVGRIDTIYIGSCPNDDPQTKKNCKLDQGKFTWLNTQLQFMASPKEKSDSQFYNKVSFSKCMNVSDSIMTRLNNGRKCLDTLQCSSRVCSEDTNVCVGKPVGETCSDHLECDADLSCRVQSIWPFSTTCQPRGEVRSSCESDFDCKTRNFCWQLSQAEERICLEKHNAPYGTQFLWNSQQYPLVNKESILFHGQYCQSGYATRRTANVAECVDIVSIQANNSQASNGSDWLNAPYKCKPNGYNQCQYRMKSGEIAFSLTCECAMSKPKDTEDIGYCPLPDRKLMMRYIDAIKQVWYQDNCHTYDRENLNAQIDCGCGDYDSTLPTALDLRFQVKYYPWVQDDSVKSCIQKVLPDSSRNIFV